MMVANDRQQTTGESELSPLYGEVLYPSEIKIFEKGDYQLLLYNIYDYFDRITLGGIFINIATFLAGLGVDGIYSYINTNLQLSLIDLCKGAGAAWVYVVFLIIGLVTYIIVLISRAKRRDKAKGDYIARFIDEGESGSNPITIQYSSGLSNIGSQPFNTDPQAEKTPSGKN